VFGAALAREINAQARAGAVIFIGYYGHADRRGGTGRVAVTAGSLTPTNNLPIVHSASAAALDLSDPGTGVTFTPALHVGTGGSYAGWP
jgi:hypothetical protein